MLEKITIYSECGTFDVFMEAGPLRDGVRYATENRNQHNEYGRGACYLLENLERVVDPWYLDCARLIIDGKALAQFELM